jgi:hypothetical protein
MKKVLFALVIAAAFTACNSGEGTTEAPKADSTATPAADTTAKPAVADSTVKVDSNAVAAPAADTTKK